MGFTAGHIYVPSVHARIARRSFTMTDDSLDDVYAFAERAFIRLQAAEILTRCLDVASTTPMRKLVESLVMTGPESLEVFREVLAETIKRKSQVEDDLQQVMRGLVTNLDSYGIQLPGISKPMTLTRMRPPRFIGMLRSQGVVDEDVQSTCLQLLQDARDLVTSLGEHYMLLAELEKYLHDWMWGIMYQITRSEKVNFL
jgi:hypothetical protein